MLIQSSRQAVAAASLLLCVLLYGFRTNAHGAKTQTRYRTVDLGPFRAREVDERPALNQESHTAFWAVIQQTHTTASIFDGSASRLINGTPSGSNSFAFGLNRKGDVVGILEAKDDVRYTHAFLYVHGGLQMLPTLGGPYGVARAISNAGVIVGNAQTTEGRVHAAAWVGGAARDLGTLPGGDYSRAFDIGRTGEIAGESNQTPNGKTHAVLWLNGRMHDLGILPGGRFSTAQAVNGKHQAVGFGDDEDGGSKAVLFSQGKITDLGTFGEEPSSALGINDAGQIVGASAVSEGNLRAFLWERGHLWNLNDLIADKSDWLLMTAYRINEGGVILASGFHQGATHLCLLIPETMPKP